MVGEPSRSTNGQTSLILHLAGAVLAAMLMLSGAQISAAADRVLTAVDPRDSDLLSSYPREMRNSIFTIYSIFDGDYLGKAPAEIVKHDLRRHGSGHLFLGVYELMADGSEEQAWDHIRRAQQYRSVQSLLLIGYAFEHGLAGYHRNLDYAEGNFRNAAKADYYRAPGTRAGTAIASKVPNHQSANQLAKFLRRHPDRQSSTGEADMIDEKSKRLWIGALNIRVNGVNTATEAPDDEQANRIVDYFLKQTEEEYSRLAETRLELANAFAVGPLLHEFSSSHHSAFKLRESVFREFPEQYGRDMSVNAVLGSHYLNGEGVELDIPRSVMHFRIAAEEGDVVSAINFAVVTSKHEGVGIERNGKEILALLLPFTSRFETLSARHRANVAYTIGIIHGNGHEVSVDTRAYYLWTRLGLDFESRQGARKLMDDAHAKMTAAQLRTHEEAYQAFRQKLGLGRNDQ